MTGHRVAHWLGVSRVEGPITPGDVDDLIDAYTWDGEYERARDLADNLTKFYTRGNTMHDHIEFGRFLGMRTALSAVIAKAAGRRILRAARRRTKPADQPVSKGAKS